MLASRGRGLLLPASGSRDAFSLFRNCSASCLLSISILYGSTTQCHQSDTTILVDLKSSCLRIVGIITRRRVKNCQFLMKTKAKSSPEPLKHKKLLKLIKLITSEDVTARERSRRIQVSRKTSGPKRTPFSGFGCFIYPRVLHDDSAKMRSENIRWVTARERMLQRFSLYLGHFWETMVKLRFVKTVMMCSLH